MSHATGTVSGCDRPAGPFRLTVVKGEGAGATFEGGADRALHIGKGGDNDFVLADRTVSRRHAVIEPTPEGYRIRDLKSLNGVVRGGKKIAEEGALLAHGDHVQLGLAVLRFELPETVADADRTVVDQAPAAPAPMETRPRPAPPPPSMETRTRPAPPPPPETRSRPAPPPPRQEAPPPQPFNPPPPAERSRRAIDTYGPFEILDVLDATDACLTELARDTGGGGLVTLRRVRARDLGYFGRRRFRSAYQQAQGVAHENVLPPVDVGHIGDYLYVTYPPLPGVSLASFLRDWCRELTIELAAFVTCEVARAVDCIQERLGAGFRPVVTPHEVLVTGAGRVALLLVPGGAGGDGIDRYRAPEEDAGGQGSGRAAVFSLGVLLYELLAREPIEVGQKTTLRSIDTVRIQVPTRIAEATMRALEVRPDDRFSRAAQLADALADGLAARKFGPAEAGRWVSARFPNQTGGAE